MPKHLITAIGLIISLGVIALGVFLVALPMYLQAVEVDAETATVANTNAIYEAQVDDLRAEEENLEAINATVASLRAQIPLSGQLDDVFEVVARAAEASGVSLTAATAGTQVPFVVRTGSDDAAEPAPVTDPAPESTTEATEGSDASADAEGRQQVDFVIRATASDLAQATSFLDALRAGPRLLNSVTAVSSQSGEGSLDLQVSALTYIDSEG
jgi:uncharacterized iron-regulated membrane protein